ncbi:MAG: cadherin-like domain-containing protein, partial [Hyphomicrobiaceae bacterium]
MEYLSTVSEKDIGSDGRVRRRYEIRDEQETGKWANIAKGLLLGNALMVIKTLFSDTAAADTEKQKNGSATDDQILTPTPEKPFRIPDLKLIENPEFEDDWNDYDSQFQSANFAARSSRSGDFFSADTAASLQFPQLPSRSIHLNPSNIIELPFQNGTAPVNRDAGSGTGPLSDGGIVLPDEEEDDQDLPGDRPGDGNPDDPDKRIPLNRLPTISGPVNLGGLYVNQSIAIGLSALLFGAHDADGDLLQVRHLSASSGSLLEQAVGSWTFAPDAFDTSSVTFTYEIADTEGAVAQVAHLDLLPIPGAEIVGTPEADRIVGTAGDDRIEGRAGDDDIFAREGNDLVDAGSGGDRIVAGPGDDVIYAGAGDDIVLAGQGNDVVFGGDGDDILSGDEGNDTLLGEAGNDTILGGEGADRAFGGQGSDRVDGHAGDDFIDGGEGNDHLTGGDGQDTLIAGHGQDIVAGNAGDDLFVAHAGDGDDMYDGGDGTDTYNLSGIGEDLAVNLDQGIVSGADSGKDKIANIENVITGAGDDSLEG